jgi:hypothetical protein
MKHELEFYQQPKSRTPSGEPGSLAVSYAMVFASPHGQRVLADLRLKFGHHRPRFPINRNERPDHAKAAVIDGECNVLREIESAIEAGTPVAQTKPNDNEP